MDKKKILGLCIDSSINENFVDLVLKRLESFTYTLEESDKFNIAFMIQKIEYTIKNSCNTASIPDGLLLTAVDMVCGHFLYEKMQTNSLGDSFNIDIAATQVSFGDTSVTFNEGASSEEKLNVLFSYLMNHGKDEFICYRKLKW